MTRRSHLPSTRELPKAYLRLDPDIDQKHPDNGWEYIRLLCASNRQRPRGIFTSRATLEAIFGKAAVRRFYDRGDVFDREDGRAETAGWDAWQEGDLTVAERVRRTRSGPSKRVTGALLKRDNVTQEQDPDALPARYQSVTSPPPDALPVRGSTSLSLSTTLTSSDSKKTVRRETDSLALEEPEAEIESQLAAWGVLGVPLGVKLRTRLALLVEDHGYEAVLTACERIHAVVKPPRDAGTYVWAAVDALEAKPNGRKPAVVVTDPNTDYDAGMNGAIVEVDAALGTAPEWLGRGTMGTA